MKFLIPLKKIHEMYIDLETTGLNPFQDDTILGVAIGFFNTKGVLTTAYYPFSHPDKKNNLTKKEQQSLLAHLMKLDKQGVLWIGHNIKFDLHFLKLLKPRFAIKGNIYDTMVAAHVSNERRRLALKKLGATYFGNLFIKPESDVLDKVASKGDLYTLPVADVQAYARMDIELTAKLHKALQKELRAQALTDYTKYQMRVTDLVQRMEARGLPINIPLTEKYLAQAKKNQKRLERKIRKITGNPDFNLRSPKQIMVFTGWKSSAQDELTYQMENGMLSGEALIFATALLEYRRWQKVDATYYTTFLERVDDSGRVHSEIRQCGAETGRFSCAKPPFQGMPRLRGKSDKIYRVRDVIHAEPGNCLLLVDYKQAEMRIGAHFAEEETMLDLLNKGVDMHSWVAETIFGVPKDDPHHNEYRQVAKNINFGTLYGLGARGLSEMSQIRMLKNVKVTYTMAQKFLNMYHKQFPGFRRLTNKVMIAGKQRGYIHLSLDGRRDRPCGRRRRYEPPFHHENELRKGINSLVQGTVAEMVNMSMLSVDEYLQSLKIIPGVILQVHDEIIMEIPCESVGIVVPKIVEICEDWDFSVPMPVDVSVGYTWGTKMSYEKFMDTEWRKLNIIDVDTKETKVVGY